MLSAERVIELLGLTPLYGEGGMYRQTYCSDEILPMSCLPGRACEKPLSSAIYYMLNRNSFSRLHRLSSDEVYHFYYGGTVEMLLLIPNGNGRVVRLGADLEKGDQFQLVVPRNTWQGLHMIGDAEFALLGTTMAPAYDQTDFEEGDLQTLIDSYPDFEDLIRVLSQAPCYQ